MPAALEGLELGPIIGKGSYGSVYRGSYQKEHVAVKARSWPLTERLRSQPCGVGLQNTRQEFTELCGSTYKRMLCQLRSPPSSQNHVPCSISVWSLVPQCRERDCGP